MKKVDIKSIVIPNRSRSGNYPTGSTVTPSGGGSNSTIINQGGGVDLTQARKEFLSKKTSDEAKGIINFLKGIKIAGKSISDLFQESSEGEITDEAIMSAARVILEISNAVGKLDNKFLRKDQSDGTSFLLKLLGGAEFGVFASGISGANIDAQGAAELLSLVLRGALTIGEYKKGLKGANIDEQGAADLLSILVRDGMESANFSTGALGAGFCLKKDENGDSYLEVDRMLVRKVATFIQLLIQQIKHVGGQIILTPASMSCAKVEDMGDYYRCYFENTDGEKTIEQEFVVGDLARAQTFNVKEGVNENVSNSYYWRAVVGVGDNYIDLSKTDCDAGSTEPKTGDDIVQLGNKSDATRQAAIILSAYGNDAPYFKLYRGINSYSLDGKEFVSFSRSEVMIIADTIRFSSGETIKEYINNVTGGLVVDVEEAQKAAEEAQKAAEQAAADASTVVEKLNKWASDGVISPTEKQSLKDEIARIDADKTQIANGYNKYSLGTPTAYNNAHTVYRAVLVTLTASSPETITIPSDFATKQTAYYTQRAAALTAISDAARDYAESIGNDLNSYKETVSSMFEQTNNSITAAVKSSQQYTDNAVGEVNTSLTEYQKEVSSQLSVLEGEISSKVSSTEITTLKTEILNTAASDATNKANKAKQDAITTAGQNADKKYATITTVSSMQTSITQLSNSLSLKAEKSEVTAVQNNLNQTNNNLSALTTRVSKAEVALEPDNIWIGISSRVTTTGKLNNIVPDSCFDDTNYSLLYSGGQRIQKDLSPSGCPTNYCMKSTASIVYANNGVSVALGEKYYISAVVNASSANYQVLVGLMLKSTSGSYSYLPIEGVTAKTTGWKTISGYVTIPSNIVEARIYFKINGSSNLGTAYFTKVYAYKVDESVNQNYALLTSSENKLTTFSNIASQWWNTYYLEDLGTADCVCTLSFNYEASNLVFNNTETNVAQITAYVGTSSISKQCSFALKANGTGEFISEPFAIPRSESNQVRFKLSYISSVLQSNKPIGYFRVWKLKVEKGERSTPWSAAPSDYSTTEEIKSGIGITKNEVSIFGKKISLSGMITFSSCDSDLQSTINGKANSSDVTSSKDDIAKKLGYSSYADMVNKASAGNTIINGGYIRTSLIDADTLVVKTLNAANDGGINTIVDKEGMSISHNDNLLLNIYLRNQGSKLYGDINMFSYNETSGMKDQAIGIVPSGIELVSYKDSDTFGEKTNLKLGELSMVDENKAGILINKTGITLNYTVGTNTTTRYIVHYAKCIYSAYISSSGSVINKIGTNIPNRSGNPITFSATKTNTGTYKITHNIGDTSYKVQITPIRGTYFPIICVKERTSTYFSYGCAHYVNGGFADADCAAFVNVYYESPKLGTF